MKKSSFLPRLAVALWFAVSAQGALILNAPQPIVQRVTVQPVVVSNSDGSNTANYFGDASQRLSIIGLINQIWAQAGIEISFLAPNAYNNTFANVGTADPRPTSDLGTVVTAGDLAGVGNANPLVIDLYFVQVAAGFSPLGPNSVAGLAFVGGNGITAYVGGNLLGTLSGQEIIASVIAHEIGHNLGLSHIVEIENLMQASGIGERLNSAQITTALASPLSVVIGVPEPSTLVSCGGVVLVLLLVRRRRTA